MTGIYTVTYTAATSGVYTVTETVDAFGDSETGAEEAALHYLLIVCAADVEITILGAEFAADHPLNQFATN